MLSFHKIIPQIYWNVKLSPRLSIPTYSVMLTFQRWTRNTAWTYLLWISQFVNSQKIHTIKLHDEKYYCKKERSLPRLSRNSSGWKQSRTLPFRPSATRLPAVPHSLRCVLCSGQTSWNSFLPFLLHLLSWKESVICLNS